MTSLRAFHCLSHAPTTLVVDLATSVLAAPAVQALARRLEHGGVMSCAGVSTAAQPFLAAVLHRLFLRRPLLVVTGGLKTQEIFHQDLETWLGSGAAGWASSSARHGSNVLFYPSWEILPHEARLPHADVVSERLDVLVQLSAGHLPLPAQSTCVGRWKSAPAPERAPVIVSSIEALLQKTFPHAHLAAGTRTISTGDRIEPLDLVEWLEAQGYEPEAKVTQKGELALRGGILDLYPLTSPWPVRLEFFGDELESLRHFDPLTQVSHEAVPSVTVPPGGELGLLKRAVAEASAAKRSVNLASLIAYLPSDALILLCEPELLEERANAYAGQVPANDPFFLPWADFQELARTRGMTVLRASEADTTLPYLSSPMAGENSDLPAEPVADARPSAPGVSLPLQSLDAFRPVPDKSLEQHVAEAQRREFFGQLHRWLRQGHAVHVFCNNQGERQRFQEIWADYGLGTAAGSENQRAGNRSQETRDGSQEAAGGIPSPPPSQLSALAPRPLIQLGTVSRGFMFEEARLVVVTDAEIFGRYKVQRPRRLKSPHAQATRSALDIDFSELEEGDYVVHLQHGIGRYLGLKVLPAGLGTKPTELANLASSAGQECLVIEYAPTDPTQPPPKLYVPVTEAHLVSKYIGTGKARPPLNTLGGARWAKAKAQAERAVRDLASELLAIQAARESQAGHSFMPDTPWQREFESAFIFEETPDQMRAILESKADMERPKPMDRLICGDVGFGKTEVAIRAAFKAVMDGRQVAVLVPTTVLAQQHFNTFRERMADYPIRIELLSRFRSRRAQAKVVKDLAAGSADIVIGTHRLLQEDVVFKDLGLVVIDEEQRFGVMQKEKFKMLRRLVDVLTLSATPIPRTLYLALSGARDMSTIQTPPQDRLPVETVVTEYDERLIRDAVQRELNRGGQVFFLHNRVMTIYTVAQKLANLVPSARLVIGHGQMHSDELEEVMTSFVNGDADVLLSTTIIESGLDIPNANTIIIDRADRFGLSDLYQLRGRVGRYKHQAYAYFLLPRHTRLLTDVRKRMSAIKQYSTLGSGFKIAMRDLEIRGAGNLLGAEQSGQITAVGFELYCQLLKQSVAAQKGEKVKPRIEVQVRLDFLALNPILDGLGTTETAASDGESRGQEPLPPADRQEPVFAYVPFKYISDARQRIEAYRKLAQADEKAAIEALRTELRDRFGPIPQPVELLLQVAELKLVAAEKGVNVIEVKEDKLMLTRSGDFIMIGSKFPRLVRRTASARLKEIKKLLLAL